MTPFELFAYCVAVVSGLIGGLVLAVLGIFTLLTITGIPFKLFNLMSQRRVKFVDGQFKSNVNGENNGKTKS